MALVAGYLRVPAAALLWATEDAEASAHLAAEDSIHGSANGDVGSNVTTATKNSSNISSGDGSLAGGAASHSNGPAAAGVGSNGRIAIAVGAGSTAVASVAAATQRLRETKVGGAAAAAGASAKRIAAGSLARAAAAAGPLLLPGAAARQRWKQTPAEVEEEVIAAAADAERCNRLRFNVNYNLCIICMYDGLDVREAFKARMPGTYTPTTHVDSIERRGWVCT